MGLILLLLIVFTVFGVNIMKYFINKWFKNIPKWLKILLLLSSPFLGYAIMAFLLAIDFL